MAVYLIIEILSIEDAARYGEYVERVRPIVEKHGGRYLVRGGEVTPSVGGWKPERMVLLEFASREELKACFASDAYREIAPLREGSTTTRSVIVEGCDET